MNGQLYNQQGERIYTESQLEDNDGGLGDFYKKYYEEVLEELEKDSSCFYLERENDDYFYKVEIEDIDNYTHEELLYFCEVDPTSSKNRKIFEFADAIDEFVNINSKLLIEWLETIGIKKYGWHKQELKGDIWYYHNENDIGRLLNMANVCLYSIEI